MVDTAKTIPTTAMTLSIPALPSPNTANQVCTIATIMKMLMIQKPRAIQEVPGFMPARTALVGCPRSASRQRLPMMRAGKLIHRPTIVDGSRTLPRKLLMAAMV